jgi:hypothetical protein
VEDVRKPDSILPLRYTYSTKFLTEIFTTFVIISPNLSLPVQDGKGEIYHPLFH